MSYIVKGAKIPVSCDSCPLMRWNDYGIDGELQYCNILDAICEHEEGQRDADCPLVDIQPHGRLIDADELKKKFPHDYDWDYPVNSNRRVNEDIDEAPTIVEAEEEEK